MVSTTPSMRGTSPRSHLLLIALTAVLACRPTQPSPPTAQRVENRELELAIVDLPAPFEVAVNSGRELRLKAPGEAGEGVLDFQVGPESRTGINLLEEAESQKEVFEALPDGRFFGNLELVTPIGTAYTSRGTHRSKQGMVEEIRVVALHPTEYRRLSLSYVYPPGEGNERMQHVAALLGELEGLEPAGQEGV